MQLPNSLREHLTDGVEKFLNNFSDDPSGEIVTNYLLEELEAFADEKGLEDIVMDLEESGSLDLPISEALENEMESNDEFEFTGEEVVVLLENMCEIDWVEDDEFDDGELDEEEEEDD